MPQQKAAVFPRLQVLMGASLWGFIGLFNRQLTTGGFTAQSIVAVRNLGVLLVLTLALLLTDRQALKIHPRHLPCFFGTGVISVVLFTLCYFRCQQICSLAVAAILVYTAPAFVVILSTIIWRERITRRKLTALILAFWGCAFVSGIFQGQLALSKTGLIMGMASGFFYGLYPIFARLALEHYPPLTVTYYTFLFAGLGSLPLLHLNEIASAFHSIPLMESVAGLVLIATVLPYLLYTKGLSRVDSGRASILASVEPVVAALVGVIAFGEPLGWGVALGLACILTTVYLLR